MLEPQPCQAFGKLEFEPDTGQLQFWLSLVDHMNDVACCFARLIRCNAINRSLEQAAKRTLTDADLARLAVLAFLHDIGKASSSFQAKRWHDKERPGYWPYPSGHGPQALVLLSGDNATAHLLDALPLDALYGWGESGLMPLLFATLGHHGRPLLEDVVTLSRVSPGDWRPVHNPNGRLQYNPLATLQAIGDEVQRRFPEAFAAVAQPLPDNPTFAHLFAGLVQFADWLGSDTRHFPLCLDADRGTLAAHYAEQAVTALGLDTAPWRDSLEQRAPTFADTFSGHAPHPIQRAMDDQKLGPLVILEAETGSGKTEAALWRFVHLFQAGAVDSLFFALPTRVSAQQLYQRVRQTIARLWPENPPLCVRALPGYSAADGEVAQHLPGFQVLWSDEPDDAQALRRWAAEAPKRFLAAPVAVGTIDQALLGIIKVKHAHMRHALLARSLLVVDEVHASDAYMGALLERLLSAHIGYGGHALLLSATLGSAARSRYLNPGQRLPVQPLEEALAAAYPAISDHATLRPVAGTGRIKSVRWSLHATLDTPEQIAQRVIEAARQGAKVLVIRNTVASAVALFERLEQHPEAGPWLLHLNGVATLHHGRFSRQDRPLLDAAIEAELGKRRPLGPRILIGTQTLEQSLDIDADLLITDLCPMDVLLQRIGRLHRHVRPAEARPDAFATPQAWVLTPTGHDLTPLLGRTAHGLGRFSEGGGIYPDLRILQATLRLIATRPEVAIPTHNRTLVEEATHPDCLRALEQELGEEWAAHARKITGDTVASRTVAQLNLLDLSRPFSGDPEMAFPTDSKVQTRLGVEDRLVNFDPPLSGPFGVPLAQLPIRHHQLPKALPPDALPERIETTAEAIHFSLGAARYRYSRLGLERIEP